LDRGGFFAGETAFLAVFPVARLNVGSFLVVWLLGLFFLGSLINKLSIYFSANPNAFHLSQKMTDGRDGHYLKSEKGEEASPATIWRDSMEYEFWIKKYDALRDIQYNRFNPELGRTSPHIHTDAIKGRLARRMPRFFGIGAQTALSELGVAGGFPMNPVRLFWNHLALTTPASGK